MKRLIFLTLICMALLAGCGGGKNPCDENCCPQLASGDCHCHGHCGTEGCQCHGAH